MTTTKTIYKNIITLLQVGFVISATITSILLCEYYTKALALIIFTGIISAIGYTCVVIKTKLIQETFEGSPQKCGDKCR